MEWVDDGGKQVEKPCSWVVDGVGEPGVYPIKPVAREWFLEQRRDNPKLSVRRWQLPLAPAYSITARGSQGQTLTAAILDLQMEDNASIVHCPGMRCPRGHPKPNASSSRCGPSAKTFPDSGPGAP